MGSGIFLLPSSLADFGSIALLGWGATSVGAVILSLLFVRLGRLSPENVGLYACTREGLGRYISSQVVYGYWVSIWIGNMAVALSAVAYLSYFIPALRGQWESCFSAIALIWLLSLLNLRDIRFIGRFQIVTSSCLMMPVLVVCIFGWSLFDTVNLTNAFNVSGLSNYRVFSETVTITLWSFIGLESACNLAGHAQKPERDVPCATLFGTLLAAIFYILSTTVIMAVVPGELLQQSASPYSLAVSLIFGDLAGEIVSVMAIIACLGSLNGWILMHGQVAHSAASDRLLPEIFKQLNRHGSPYMGLLITAVIMSIMLLMTMEPTIQRHFEFIILIAVYMMLLAYFCACLSCFVIQKRLQRTGEIGWNFILCCSTIYCIWGICGSGITVLLYGSILIVVGGVFYWWVHRRDGIGVDLT